MRNQEHVRLKHAGALLLAVIREIFDESAYQRFLGRANMPSSAEAYAAFQKEHDAIKARRPPCC
jgi:hypothetical protein